MDCNKVQYGSKKMADDDIARISKKSNRSTIPIRSYICKYGFWHLTSKEDMFKYSEKEMENKRIVELIEEVKKLKVEIASLKDNTNREINKEVKVDAKVQKLNELINKQDRQLLLARKDNSELIARIVQLEKLLPKNQAY